MSIQIDTANRIKIDGQDTGLALVQRREGTVVYTPESRPSWQKYQEHTMPFGRYSAAHDAPHKPGEGYDPNVCAGRSQLEADVQAMLASFWKA